MYPSNHHKANCPNIFGPNVAIKVIVKEIIAHQQKRCETCGVSHRGQCAHQDHLVKNACVAIVRGSEVLITTESAGRWSGRDGLPGGQSNPGEKPFKTACREMQEEVGKSFDQLEKSGITSIQFDDVTHQNGSKTRIFVIQVANQPIGFILNPKEISAAKWVNKNNLLNRSLNLRPGMPHACKLILAKVR